MNRLRKRAESQICLDYSASFRSHKSFSYSESNYEDSLERTFNGQLEETSSPSLNKNSVSTTRSDGPFRPGNDERKRYWRLTSATLGSFDGVAVNFVKYRYPRSRHFRERGWGELKATILCIRAMQAFANHNAVSWKRLRGKIRGKSISSRQDPLLHSIREKPSKLIANPIAETGGIVWHLPWKPDTEIGGRFVIRYGSFRSPLTFWEPEAARYLLRGLEDATFCVLADEDDIDESRVLGVADDVRVLVAIPFNGDGGYSYRKQNIARKLAGSKFSSERYCVVLPASPYYFYREGKDPTGKTISEGQAKSIAAVSEYFVKGITLGCESAVLLRHLYFDGYRKLGILGTSLGGYACALGASLAQIPLAVATCFLPMDGGVVVNGVLGKLVDWKRLHSSLIELGEFEAPKNDDALPRCTCSRRSTRWLKCTKAAWRNVSSITSLKRFPTPILSDRAVVVGAANDGFVENGAAEVAELWNASYWEIRGGHASGIVCGDNGISAIEAAFTSMRM